MFHQKRVKLTVLVIKDNVLVGTPTKELHLDTIT